MRNRLEGRWERFRRLIDWGVRFLFIIVAVSLGKGRLIDAFTPQGIADFPVAQMFMLLFIATIVLIFLWLKATSGEYQMLYDHFSEFIPPIPGSSYPIVFGLAILGGALCYFSDNLVVYSVIFVCYTLVEIWGIWVRDSKIKVALHSARNEVPANDKRREAWIIIENYYLEKPQTQLAISGLFFSFVVLILSLSAELVERQALSSWLLSIGYGVMLLNVVINEMVYATWRRERDHALHEEYS